MEYHIEEVDEPAVRGLAVRATVPMGALPGFFGSAYGELWACGAQSGAHPAGPPFARYFSVAPGAVDVEAVMPFEGPLAPTGRARLVELPPVRAARLEHVGLYDTIHAAYEAVERWLGEHHRSQADVPREVYLTEPGSTPDPEQWRTRVVIPLAG